MANIMTHEDFAHICLKIRDGDTDTPIPCCGNCEYYVKRNRKVGYTNYVCVHPRLNYYDVGTCLIMQPEDFCSRYTERSE